MKIKNYFSFIFPFILFSIIFIFSSTAIILNIKKKNDFTSIPSPLIGKLSPEFEFYLLSDKKQKLNLKNFKDKPILVNFFSSWCIPCRTENLQLIKLSKTIPIVGIAYKDKKDNIKEFLKNYGNPYSVIGNDPFGDGGIAWGIYGIPETYLLNRNGIIQFKHAGPINDEIKKHILNFINNLK
tara:strand:+ start:593 stop:1138 length:546 start_codon:yes stop_codon:yes gene_type:complete